MLSYLGSHQLQLLAQRRYAVTHTPGIGFLAKSGRAEVDLES